MINCTEGGAASYFSYFHNDYILDLESYAMIIKFVPSNYDNATYYEYAVQAKICSNPVIALNNNYETSFTINEETYTITNYSNLDNWIGSDIAKSRLINDCYGNTELNGEPRDFTSSMYHACGNGEGIHVNIKYDFINPTCWWNHGDFTGSNIDIYFGFDLNKTIYCNYPKYVNIEIYSRGADQLWLFDTRFSFIRVNGTEYQSLSDQSLNRGLMIVILDENNPVHLVGSKTFDFYSGTDTDIDAVNYLNNISSNRIILISVYDTANSIPQTMNILHSWGCHYNNISLTYRESFIFVGTKNITHNPPWTYCMKHARNGSAIFKTFKIHNNSNEYIVTSNHISEPTVQPTINPTVYVYLQHAQTGCSNNHQLGYGFSGPSECAQKAVITAVCNTAYQISWTDWYPASWGCRCCKTPDLLNSNQYWQIWAYLPSPTRYPTNIPTISPSISPSFEPTLEPIIVPTLEPTNNPTKNPTDNPTNNPSIILTISTPNDESGEYETTSGTTSTLLYDHGNRNETNSNDLGLIIGLIAGITVILIMVISLLIWRLKKKKQNQINHTNTKSEMVEFGKSFNNKTDGNLVNVVNSMTLGNDTKDEYEENDNVTTKGLTSDNSKNDDMPPIIPPIVQSDFGDKGESDDEHSLEVIDQDKTKPTEGI